MTPPLTLEPEFTFEAAGISRRFTRHEYHRLAAAGVLNYGDPVELLDGFVTLKLDHVGLPRPRSTFPELWPLRRWSVADYHAMIRAGILGEGEPVELLDGYLVRKMSRGPAHDCALDLLRAALAGLIPAGTYPRSQQAITLAETEPEPDYAVVRGGPRVFATRHPGGPEVRLVVEVADSSLTLDRGPKAELYAAAGIPVYWVVDIPDAQIEVYA
ncbi:MAG: Uma2 family endonuclease, partial [Gemmataceae bacterium]|nr:Uma2 family endonuclease [Gemmataceae bacterium]